MSFRDRHLPTQLRDRERDMANSLTEEASREVVEERVRSFTEELDAAKREALSGNDPDLAKAIDIVRYDIQRRGYMAHAARELGRKEFEKAKEYHVEAVRLERDLSNVLLHTYRDETSSKYFDAEADEIDARFLSVLGEMTHSTEQSRKAAELDKISALKYMEIDEFEEAGDRYLGAAASYASAYDIDNEGECIAYATQAYENVRDPARRNEALSTSTLARATYLARLTDFRIVTGDLQGSKKASEGIIENSRLAKNLLLELQDSEERKELLSRADLLSNLGQAFLHRAQAALSVPKTEKALEEIEKAHAILDEVTKLALGDLELQLVNLLRMDMAVSKFLLKGVIAYERGEIDESEKSFQDAKYTLEELRKNLPPDAPEVLLWNIKSVLATSESLRLGYVGEVKLRKHDFRAALDAFRASVGVLDGLLQEAKKPLEAIEPSIKTILSFRIGIVASALRFWNVYLRMVEVSQAAFQSNDQSALRTAEDLRATYAKEYFPIPGNPVKFVPTRIRPSAYALAMSLSTKVFLAIGTIAVLSTIVAVLTLVQPASPFFLIGSAALILSMVTAVSGYLKTRTRQ